MSNNDFLNPLSKGELEEIVNKVNMCLGKYKKVS